MDAVETANSLEEAKAFSKAARMAYQENDKKTLILESVENKIQAIKEIRDLFGYGLKESKDIVETTNYDIGSFLYGNAMRIKTRLEAVGCKVRMV